MKLSMMGDQADSPQCTGIPPQAPHPALNLLPRRVSVPKKKQEQKQKHVHQPAVLHEHATPVHVPVSEREIDEDTVAGEVERPAPASDKPQCCA